jgi:hypothetical protein
MTVEIFTVRGRHVVVGGVLLTARRGQHGRGQGCNGVMALQTAVHPDDI